MLCTSIGPADRLHGIIFFFAGSPGSAELMLGRPHEAIALLRKSLECNSTFGSLQPGPEGRN